MNNLFENVQNLISIKLPTIKNRIFMIIINGRLPHVVFLQYYSQNNTSYIRTITGSLENIYMPQKTNQNKTKHLLL